ncbi:hypothetical protein Patl1_01101 [Pistacia atlantica]|uniref:Uncharacterized protein n=1 Tax=Pistacia atlantica TaxID=434234 RepID=A0ACC1C8Y1_9ROSI|nr:hypothetical protein Patl1_01101 [Pistacia atlantica]
MGGVGGEGKGFRTDKVASQSRKRMDCALPSDHNHGGKDELYTELWRACAGPLVYVPRAGDKVYYFLQGHIEQVEAYMTEDGKMEMPIYKVPSKILCEVAEAGTDEVYAQITLLPKPEQDEPSLEDATSLPSPSKVNVCSFSKKLTPSDTSTHGGFSVPKRHADECLPPLVSILVNSSHYFLKVSWPQEDMSKDPPAQQLVAKDLHGYEWHFRHIYRGQPKRHLLTSGWSIFVTSKKLVAGDACIFLRGENGELRVGVRRTMKLQNNMPTSIISGPSMQHGILATASHAISTGTRFTVYYRPWSSPAEFIVPFDHYMRSAEINYSVGTRFRMAIEDEECAEQRIFGTIVGAGDIDQNRWPNSAWRRLKVKWDVRSDTLTRPERVSPWNIEPMTECTNRNPASVLPRIKRLRSTDATSPGFSSFVSIGGLQGQENRITGVKQLDALKLPLLPYFVPPPDPHWAHMQLGPENKLQFPMHSPFYRGPSSAESSPGGSIVPDVNSLNSGSQDWRALELRDENGTPLAPPNDGGRYMLFGVNLFKCSPPELPSPQVANSIELESHGSIPPISQSSVSETIQVSDLSKSVSGNPSEMQCKNCHSFRSCTKVLKYGTVLGRSVDLTQFDGYEELLCELDKKFDFKGSLIDGSSGWHVTYMDYEGDMMVAGDYPWQLSSKTWCYCVCGWMLLM